MRLFSKCFRIVSAVAWHWYNIKWKEYNMITRDIFFVARFAGVDLDAGSIIGIVVGVLVLVLIIFLVIFARATGRWCFAGELIWENAHFHSVKFILVYIYSTCYIYIYMPVPSLFFCSPWRFGCAKKKKKEKTVGKHTVEFELESSLTPLGQEIEFLLNK